MSRPRCSAALAAIVIAAAATGCSIRPDSLPRDIAPEDLTAAQPETSDVRVGVRSTIYLLEQEPSNQLRPSGRDVVANVSNLMDSLLAGAGEADKDNQLRTAIPPDTELRGIGGVEGGVAVIDVSSEFATAQGELLADALSQLVFTATSVNGIRAVIVTVEGERQSWLIDGRARTEPLSRFDFPGRLRNSQPALPPTPG